MHLDKVADLCRRAGARRLEIFGSAVRPDFDPATSDLDFLVEFDELPPARYADAFFALKESLEVLFGRPIDLIQKEIPRLCRGGSNSLTFPAVGFT